MSLRLDWCSHEAAKYAVEKWHYSRSLPAGKVVRVGVWEHKQFIGAVIFSRGSNKHLGVPFGLEQTECVELARVALSAHRAPVSKALAFACKMLRSANPGLRLIISFADPNRQHVGTIYQAANWIYTGVGTTDQRSRPYVKGGRVFHWRMVNAEIQRRGMSNTIQSAVALGYEPQEHIPKHRYLYPLDAAMRQQIEPLRKPYPKRAGSIVADAPAIQAGEGGAVPTPALQTSETD
jgi:hypothetical protein